MNSSHVTNLDLSKALFEAGITKDYESEFYWNEPKDPTDFEHRGPILQERECCYQVDGKVRHDNSWALNFPALLLSELLELMPETLKDKDTFGELTLTLTKCEAYYYSEPMFNDYVHHYSGEPVLKAVSNLATYLLREGKFNKPTTK